VTFPTGAELNKNTSKWAGIAIFFYRLSGCFVFDGKRRTVSLQKLIKPISVKQNREKILKKEP
jgi:hypothetical protein